MAPKRHPVLDVGRIRTTSVVNVNLMVSIRLLVSIYVVVCHFTASLNCDEKTVAGLMRSLDSFDPS